MQRTRLGQTDLEISRIVFGSMGRRHSSEADRIRVIHAAIDAGITTIDTAPLYDFGKTETVLGRAIRGRRDDVEILSKVGLRWDGDGLHVHHGRGQGHGELFFELTDDAGVRRAVRRDSRPIAIRKDVEASLRRLGTDHIDLCQIHQPDRSGPIEESLGELARLVEEGKILQIGVSNFTLRQLGDACAALAGSTSSMGATGSVESGPTRFLASDQLHYSLVTRFAEQEIVPLARREGFDLLAYSPLGAGALSDRMLDPDSFDADARLRSVHFRPANAKAIRAALSDSVEPVAAARAASVSQICLSWLLHQDHVAGVIAGASDFDQVHANAAACEIQLEPEELQSIGDRFLDVRIDPLAGQAWSMRIDHFLGRVRRKLGRIVAPLSVALLFLACGGSEPPLPTIGEPATEADQLSWFRHFAIDRVLDYRVWSGARAGFVALVARNGRVVYARTTGEADLASGAPMTLDTRFHLASMTKPVTAVAAMILVEDGRLSLDDPVAAYIPAFADAQVVRARDDAGGWTSAPLSSPIRIRHLLSFTAGIGGYAETGDRLDQLWRSPDIETAGLGSLADRVALVAMLPLYEEPGTKWRYGWSFDVLARVIEVAAREPFDAFLRRRIFEPLGMDSTGFPDALPRGAQLATMYTHDEAGDLVHDPRFEDDYGRGWTPGGGGLLSTAPDYLRFAMMLAGGGVLEGARILSPETVAEMTRLHVPSGVLEDIGIEGLGWGLGLCVVADASKTMMPATNGDFWWSGRFGTQFWISPAKRTIVVVMQQTERGPYSDLPVTPSLVQLLAML